MDSAQDLSGSREPKRVPGQLIVRFRKEVERTERADIHERNAERVIRPLLLPRTQLVRIKDDLSIAEAIERYEQDPRVLFAEPNVIRRIDATIPNDPSFGDLWGLNNTGQTVNGTAGTADADIDAPEAWDTETGSSGVLVGVVDSGVAYDHPDLSGNMWANPGESGGGKEANGIDDDGNGLIDDFRGWDWVNDDNDPRDDLGHGTHVAGTIGAVGNNATGVTGVNWDVALAPLKVCRYDLICVSSAIIDALVYSGDMGFDIVNGSFSGAAPSLAEQSAITSAPDTLFVFAAGNDGADNDDVPQYPCSYPMGNVLCVAATDQNDGLASFSNYGATTVDLGAPGKNVLSTIPEFETPFSDNFEVANFATTWTTGGTNNTWARSGTTDHFMTDTTGVFYANNTDSFARTATGIDLSTGDLEACRLDYQLHLATSPGDFLHIEASTDAVNWTPLQSWTGSTGAGFFPFQEELFAFDGNATVYLRFRLVTNASGTNTGAEIDDIAVTCVSADGVYAGDEYASEDGTSMATPHVSGAAALLVADDPTATMTEVRNAILVGVDPKPALATTTTTGGRLNMVGAQAALAASSAVHRLTVVKRGPGTGSVTSSPAGIACPPDCDQDYSPSTVVTLSAATTGVSEFEAWEGEGCSGTGTCIVTMNAARHVEAMFITPWSTFQHDPRHTGRSGLLGAQQAGVKWTFDTALIPATPAVGADGTIYLPTGAQSEYPAGTLYAINPDGSQQWAFALPGYTDATTPAIGADGTIYVHNRGTVGAAKENVVAINPNGTQKWIYESSLGFDSKPYAPPTVDRDGTIWVGFFDTYLRRLNPADGSVACAVSPSASSIHSSVAIAPDGTVYVVDASGLLFAIEPTCSVRWSFDVGGSPGSPTVAADGTVWVGSGDVFAPNQYLYAINPNGTLKCQAPTNDPIPSTPAIAADGTVYAVADGLYAIDPTDCSQDWRFAPSLSGNSSSSPIVDANGTIYWRTAFNAYAVNPNGTQKWTTPVSSSGGQALDPSGVVGSNGTLYLADGYGGSAPKRLRALADMTPPQTTIDTGPSGPTGDNTPTFTFSSSEAGSSFQCRVVPDAFAPCTSPHTTGVLSDGAHTFEVRATDPSGNTDATPASRAFTVDADPPETTVTGGPSGPTTDSTPTFTFSSDEGSSTFQCRVAPAAFAACTSPHTTGVLTDGAHTFEVKATDPAGNIDPTPASRAFTVDTDPPETTITGGPSGPTMDSTPTFTFSSDEGSSTFQCRVDLASFASCTSPHTTSSLAEGAHTFEVRAADAAGNIDATPASRSFSVDGTPPVVSFDSGPSGPTNDNTPTFTFHANEPVTFECKVDDGAYGACSGPGDAHTTGTLSEGPHTFSVRGTDAVSLSSTNSRSFTVDTDPPETTFDSGPSGPTNDATPTFTFSSDEGSSTFQCRVVPDPFATCTSPHTTGVLGDGPHTFEVKGTDPAGNTDPSAASRAFTVDTDPPETTVGSGPSGPTNDATPTFTFSSDEAGTFQCRVDLGSFASCSSPHTSAVLSDGPHTFEVKATDPAGNSDSTPDSRGFTVDTAAPASAITFPSTGTAYTSSTYNGGCGGSTPDVCGTASDTGGTGVASVQIRIRRATDNSYWNGAAWQVGEAWLLATGTTSWSFTFTPAEDTYTLSARAIDNAGSIESTASATFTIDDTAPNTTITGGPSGPTSDNTPQFAFSSDEGSSSFQCRVVSGAFAPCTSPHTTAVLSDGPHTFEVKATDPAGNTDGSPASRAFTVDTDPPETTVDSGPSGPTSDATPTFTFSSDEAGTFQCRVDVASFASCTSSHTTAVLSDGPHTFEVKATDPVGNTDPSAASRAFTVDTDPPETTIDSGPSGPTNDTTPTFAFSSDEGGSTFQCRVDSGPFAPCTSPHTTAALGDGARTFEVKATDPAGNQDFTPDSQAFTVDTDQPETTIDTGPTGVTNDNTPTFTFSSDEGGSMFQCRVDVAAFASCSSPHTTLALTNGIHTFDVRATDPAGNQDSTPDSRTFTVEAPPQPPPPAPQPQARDLLLKAKPRKVEKGDRVTLTGTLTLCTPGSVIEFQKRRGDAFVLFASVTTGDDCIAQKKVRVRKRITFGAEAPAEPDYLEAASNPVTVKVKPPS